MTQKRKSIDYAASSKIPRLTSLSQSNTSLAEIVDNKVRSLCDKEIMGELITEKLQQFLPQITKSVEEAVSLSIRTFMKEMKETIIGNTSNAPPPPPSNLSREPQTHYEANPEYVSCLQKFALQRMRPNYQLVRHTGLVKVFQNGLDLDDPCIPRKFAEHVGRNDAEKIVEMKKRISINNVSNEIEILKIYAADDEERVNKIDLNANTFINSLSDDNDKVKAKEFYQKLINKDSNKTDKIWKRKNDFLTSNKYLIPVSKLITLDGKSQFYKKSIQQENNNHYNKSMDSNNSKQQYFNTRSFNSPNFSNSGNTGYHHDNREIIYKSFKNNNNVYNRQSNNKKPYSQVVKFRNETFHPHNDNFR